MQFWAVSIARKLTSLILLERGSLEVYYIITKCRHPQKVTQGLLGSVVCMWCYYTAGVSVSLS